jgi:hypothetical protein
VPAEGFQPQEASPAEPEVPAEAFESPEAPAAEPLNTYVDEEDEEASKPGCGDKVVCGDTAAAEALGMRNGRVMIPEENQKLMDKLEKSDGARGIHNLEHAVKSIAGFIEPKPTHVQKIRQ